MTTPPIPYLFTGQKVVNADGTLESWFVNAWNDLIDRVGGQQYSSLYGVINGEVREINRLAAQAQASATAAQTAAAAVSATVSTVQVGVGGYYLTASTVILTAGITGGGTATTDAVTLTPNGGTAPHTYAWTKLSGDTLTVSAPTSATTTFSSTLTLGQTKSAIYRGTSTDATTATASKDVAVTLSSAPPDGGGGDGDWEP